MTHVAFLRAINVGGTSIIKMVDLAKAFEAMGFTDVKTYIQSGNVVFNANEKEGNLLPRKGELSEGLRSLLEMKIEKALAKHFKTSPKIIVRTIEEFKNIANFIPFSKAQKKAAPLVRDSGHKGGWGDFSMKDLGDNTKLSLYVSFLSREPTKEEDKVLASFENEHERFLLRGKEIYSLIRKDVGKVGVYTKGTFEKKLGIPLTTRNYLTMGKMLEWLRK